MWVRLPRGPPFRDSLVVERWALTPERQVRCLLPEPKYKGDINEDILESIKSIHFFDKFRQLFLPFRKL
jgi:hypothetical protein